MFRDLPPDVLTMVIKQIWIELARIFRCSAEANLSVDVHELHDRTKTSM
jgi:hypothetical protein